MYTLTFIILIGALPKCPRGVEVVRTDVKAAAVRDGWEDGLHPVGQIVEVTTNLQSTCIYVIHHVMSQNSQHMVDLQQTLKQKQMYSIPRQLK